MDSELKWIGHSKGPGMNEHYVAPTLLTLVSSLSDGQRGLDGPGPRPRQDYMDAEGRIASKTVP